MSEAERTRTKCAAAQGICNMSKHGDEKVVRARQIFMSDLGAIPVLLESLSATKDGNLQFWCAVAATKIVDDNDLSSDAFVDAGGLTSSKTSKPAKNPYTDATSPCNHQFFAQMRDVYRRSIPLQRLNCTLSQHARSSQARKPPLAPSPPSSDSSLPFVTAAETHAVRFLGGRDARCSKSHAR